MKNAPSVLFVVLARKGSRGVENKNIQPLAGLPLLAYRILTARKSGFRHEIIISTDSAEYQKTAVEFGARAPFLRPAELATHSASSVGALLHAMNWMSTNEPGKKWEYVCLLEPTNPFTKVEWIDDAIGRLVEKKRSSIVAVRPSMPHPAFIQDESDVLSKVGKSIWDLDHKTSRQAFPPQITPSGNFYISEWNFLVEKRSFYHEKTLAYKIPDLYSLEIDEKKDFLWAEFLMEKELISKKDLGI